MSKEKQISIVDFSDVVLEKEFLHGLMCFYDMPEAGLALLSAKREYFLDEGHREFFEFLQQFEATKKSMKLELVRAEVMQQKDSLEKTFLSIIATEPMVQFAYAVDKLKEWYKRRELFLLSKKIENALFEGNGSLSCVHMVENNLDKVLAEDESDTPTFSYLDEMYKKEPPSGKINTGISFLDQKGGMELGSFIGLLGDEDSGKTTFGSQILRNVTKQGFKVLFFPLEFKSRRFIEQNRWKVKKGLFNPELFLIEDRYTDLYDIAAKIREEALKGVKVVLIDSQMVIDVNGNFPNEAKKETEKFKVLQRLAIRLEIVIIFICQRNNSHSAANVIAPYGSTHAKHFLHEIWFIKKYNLKFTKDGEEERKGQREFLRTKSKMGGYFSKPILLDPKTWEFRGRQYDEDDPRSTKTIGSGRKKKSEAIEVVYENSDGSKEVVNMPKI